jgi:hypothetical protein
MSAASLASSSAHAMLFLCSSSSRSRLTASCAHHIPTQLHINPCCSQSVRRSFSRLLFTLCARYSVYLHLAGNCVHALQSLRLHSLRPLTHIRVPEVDQTTILSAALVRDSQSFPCKCVFSNEPLHSYLSSL